MRSLHGALMAIVIATAILLQPSPSRAETDPSISEFVSVLDQSVRAIAASAVDRDRKCLALMQRLVDFDGMIGLVLGRTWHRMSGSQRNRFREAFEKRVATECVRSAREYQGERFTLAGVRKTSNGDRLATTRYSTNNQPGRMITWRLPGDGPAKAIDVIADGTSAAGTARKEYEAVLQSNQGSIDALLASMN